MEASFFFQAVKWRFSVINSMFLKIRVLTYAFEDVGSQILRSKKKIGGYEGEFIKFCYFLPARFGGIFPQEETITQIFLWLFDTVVRSSQK